MPSASSSGRKATCAKPGTADTLERLDPLFCDGAPNSLSSGGNGSFAFYNSNVRAAQVNSPIQFGQAARIVSSSGGYILVTGVPERALSQEFYVEYTRVLSRRWFLTAGVTVARPDDGVEALVPTGAKTWIGGLFNLTCQH